jgi:predicted DNA-binding protein with PD1-like motif
MTDFKLKRTLIERLPHGVDLYEELTRIARHENIRCGRIAAIGATTHAIVAFYDQATNTYNPLDFEGGMEILSLQGNISVRDEAPFVHAHILLGDKEGKMFGGHLLPGTKIFACEVIIDVFDGRELVRAFDEQTELYLWKPGDHLR